LPVKELPAQPLEPLLSLDETAAILGITRQTLRRIIRRSELMVVSVGARRCLVEPDAVRAYIAARRSSPSSPGGAP
jgi:excisionase family DNA binding protein